MGESVRTFIAAELSGEVREFLARCQERLRRTGADVRWVRTDQIHLTLVFLGNVAAERLESLEAAVRGAAAGYGAMMLRAQGAGKFPPRGLPRVVWIGIEEPTGRLAALQKAVAEAAVPFAEKKEDRAYAAHLTFGRARSAKNARPLDEAIAAMAGETGPAFEVREVVIFQSALSPQGPTYTALARIPLEAKG